jgi:ubiquinone/menaquinone biosynthesis C-methylase UbiE
MSDKSITPEPLDELDRAYLGMFDSFKDEHPGVVSEMAAIRDAEGLSNKVLEIACGTGWNIANFVNQKFDYYGLDISETAIAIAMRKFPVAKFFNLPAINLSLIAEGSFDMVYCASMLEHLSEYAQPIAEMMRIARRHLFVLFYEGLLPGAENKIEFHEKTEPYVSPFGVKFVDYQLANRGYYMNRYARDAIVKAAGDQHLEFLDASNRSYIKGAATILHVTKSLP